MFEAGQCAMYTPRLRISSSSGGAERTQWAMTVLPPSPPKQAEAVVSLAVEAGIRAEFAYKFNFRSVF